MKRRFINQWRIQREFHGFHRTPFEGLPSKILCANALRTLCSHWSYALQLQQQYIIHQLNAHVSTPVSRIQRVHGLCAHLYYQKHVANIETMSEASKWSKVYSCIAPSVARGGFMLSVSLTQITMQLLCSHWGLKQSHAFNSAGFKHDN